MEAPSADTTAESLPAERRGLYAAHLSRQPQTDEQRHAEVGPYGEQIPVREVDQLEHPVHHGVPERHQGIDAADGQPVHKLLQKLIHV